MKLFSLILTFCILSNFLFAQEKQLEKAIEHINNSDYMLAIEKLQEAKEKASKKENLKADINYYLSLAHFKNNQPQQAKNYIEESISKAKPSVDAFSFHFLAGQIYHQLFLYEEAKQAYEKSIEANKTFGEAYFHLGNIFLETNQLKEACLNFKLAIKHNYTKGQEISDKICK